MHPIAPHLKCDDAFDMFVMPLNLLDEQIECTGDEFTRGYLQGVRDFREQLAIITGSY